LVLATYGKVLLADSAEPVGQPNFHAFVLRPTTSILASSHMVEWH
jgi:hypothetical protein